MLKYKYKKERAVLKTVALVILVKNNYLNPLKFKDGYFLLSFFNATIHALTTETINRFIPIIVCTIS